MLFVKGRVWPRCILAFLILIDVCRQSTKAKDFNCDTNEVQFKCLKGEIKCIPKSWECDGEDDCPDKSDEQQCTKGHCEMQEKFKCKHDDTCISKQWVCDGTSDCADHSDENPVQCANLTCSTHEFTCANKKCIYKGWKCDSQDDCGDGSDLAANLTCSTHEFTCANKKCIYKGWKCDSQDDCGDGSDEVICGPQTCQKTVEFQCKNKKCIDIKWRCDHDNDCDDLSDEENCSSLRACTQLEFQCKNDSRCIPKDAFCDNYDDCKDNSDEPASCTTKKDKCNGDKFNCKDGDCIPKSWKCDGDIDCVSGDDEKNCCAAGKIACGDEKCIDKSQQCDKIQDCANGSDEENCAYELIRCDEQQFECKTSKQCINDSQVCDTKNDCADKSDESETCGRNECDENRGGCQHNCLELKIGCRCLCDAGFELADDGKSCKDIDECDEFGKCSQVCKNTEGGYKCSCVAGYLLDGKDLTSCKAIESDPYLVFSDRHSIRKLTLHQLGFFGVVPNLPGSIALDYHLAQNTMYWTDVNNETIQRVVLTNEDNDNPKVETIIANIRIPDGIAVDWVTKKLYWTDAWLRRIEVSELDGKNRRVLIDSDLDAPRAIVLYPAIGEIFWTDWGAKPKIERCGMDGAASSRKAIITKDILWPNALTVDYTIDRIWWADAKRHVIEHCDLHGENRKVVLSRENVFHPFSISVFEDIVYWTDWYKTSIYKANKFTGHNLTLLKSHLVHPMGIRVIHAQRQPAAFNFCQKYNGECSHLCLLSAQRQNKTNLYSCSCPTNIKLLPDNKTCDTPDALKCGKGMCNSGTCLPGKRNVRGPSCICNRGFSGSRCDYQVPVGAKNAQETKDDVAVTIGITVGVVTVIFICGALVGYTIYKRLQKRYNPNSLNFDNPVYTKTTESIESGGSTLIPFRFRKNPPQAPFSKDPEPVDL